MWSITDSLRIILSSKDPMRRTKECTNVRASVDSVVRRGTSSSPVSASSTLGTRGFLRGAGSAGVSDSLQRFFQPSPLLQPSYARPLSLVLHLFPGKGGMPLRHTLAVKASPAFETLPQRYSVNPGACKALSASVPYLSPFQRQLRPPASFPLAAYDDALPLPRSTSAERLQTEAWP